MERYTLYANDTGCEIWAVRRGRGLRWTGICRVQPDVRESDLPTLAYQTETWRIQWLRRNLMHFRTVAPADAGERA